MIRVLKMKKSIFSLTRLINGIPNGESNVSTWDLTTENEVIKLYKKQTTEPVNYTRKRNWDNFEEPCSVVRFGEELHVLTFDSDYTFLVTLTGSLKEETNVVPATLTDPSKEETNVDLHDDKLCPVCFDLEKTHLVGMCGHLTCLKCVVSLKECPMCRGALFEKAIKII